MMMRSFVFATLLAAAAAAPLAAQNASAEATPSPVPAPSLAAVASAPRLDTWRAELPADGSRAAVLAADTSRHGSPARSGAIHGAVFGAALGFLLGNVAVEGLCDSNNCHPLAGGAVVAVPGALLGALIGYGIGSAVQAVHSRRPVQ
jgi:hypothetical protein